MGKFGEESFLVADEQAAVGLLALGRPLAESTVISGTIELRSPSLPRLSAAALRT